MFACNGILFNHESPNRGETFVTRKITMTVSDIALGLEKKLFLGNLDSKRDWGHAKDYIEAMWLILQQDKAEDFVVATGKTTKVRDFLNLAFAEVGITIGYNGKGVNEIGSVENIDVEKYKKVTGFDTPKVKVGQELIFIDPYYFRPTEVDLLLGDPSKIKRVTGWEPKYSLLDLVKDMMNSDLKRSIKKVKHG